MDDERPASESRNAVQRERPRFMALARAGDSGISIAVSSLN